MSTPPPVDPPPPSTPSPVAVMPVHPSRYIAGFWRRVGAFAIDSVALGAVGAALGFAFFDTFAAMGQQGRWIGFVVAGAYFSVLNSRVGRGQTLGKRLLEIEVIDARGSHLSLARSVGRYLPLGFALILSNALVPASAVFGPIGVVIGALTTVIVILTIYLIVFNSRSRRTLHDFLAGTYVVRKAGSGEPTAYPFWRGHVAILIAIALLAAGASVWFVGKFQSLIPGLENAYIAVLQTGKVNSANIFVGANWQSHNGQRTTTRFVTCTALWKSRPTDYQAAGAEIARVLFDHYPAVKEKDALIVTIAYGYDIGIAHGSVSQRFQYTPAEWQELIAAPKAAK